MKTKSEIIAELKIEYPNLRIGNDEEGYTELDTADYENVISQWADNIIVQQETEAAILAKREAALAKLALLGLDETDIKALGL